MEGGHSVEEAGRMVAAPRDLAVEEAERSLEVQQGAGGTVLWLRLAARTVAV